MKGESGGEGRRAMVCDDAVIVQVISTRECGGRNSSRQQSGNGTLLAGRANVWLCKAKDRQKL